MSEQDLTERYREVNRNNPFIRHNFIEVVRVERDRAALRLSLREESRNVYGLAHGGAIYAIADNACGCAASTDGRSYVTQSSDFHYLRNQSAGEIRASAHIRHRGKSTVLAEVEVTGEDGKLLATGSFTFFCVDREVMLRKGGRAPQS